MRASGDAPGPHTPALYHQVLSALRPGAGSRYVDGTVGAGGHATGLLEASAPDGELLGLDLDPRAIELAAERLARFSGRVHLLRASFADMGAYVRELSWGTVDGVLLDLGLSSMQVDDARRGFSLPLEGPLDMRFDPGQAKTAEDLVNGLPERDLADLIYRFGEEPGARRVAREIIRARPLHTTLELSEVVTRVLGRRGSRIHPATRTFQALRIAVNDELETLEAGLAQALQVLGPGGRLAIVAFHSLEDRIVKLVMRRESRDCICPPGQPECTCGHQAVLRVLTPRPVRPEANEVRANPRARSARLRVAERLA